MQASAVIKTHSVYFPLRNAGRISREGILVGLKELVSESEILGIQLILGCMKN